MNKNSKNRQKLLRAQAKANRSSSEAGSMVISCNAPPRGKTIAPGCERVYINKGPDGKKSSITRHEAVTDPERGHVVCRRKVGSCKSTRTPRN